MAIEPFAYAARTPAPAAMSYESLVAIEPSGAEAFATEPVTSGDDEANAHAWGESPTGRSDASAATWSPTSTSVKAVTPPAVAETRATPEWSPAVSRPAASMRASPVAVHATALGSTAVCSEFESRADTASCTVEPRGTSGSKPVTVSALTFATTERFNSPRATPSAAVTVTTPGAVGTRAQSAFTVASPAGAMDTSEHPAGAATGCKFASTALNVSWSRLPTSTAGAAAITNNRSACPGGAVLINASPSAIARSRPSDGDVAT